MSDMTSAQYDLLMEVLIDFAEWRGDCAEDAEWAADKYLRECARSPLSPATRQLLTRQVES